MTLKTVVKIQRSFYLILLVFIGFTELSVAREEIFQQVVNESLLHRELLDNSNAIEIAMTDNGSTHYLNLNKNERDYLNAKKKLTICVDPDWMPYEKIENGEHIGMSADFVQLISEQLQIPIVLVPSSTWTESIALGKQRQCDFFSLIMSTPERAAFLDFSNVYLSFPLVIATRYEQAFIDDLADVLDKRIGIQKGYAYVELLRLKYPSINLIEVDSLEDGLEKVINSDLFGMIGSLPSVAYSFQKNAISELMISGKLAQMWHLGLGARNDEPLLIKILNKAIAQVNQKKLQKITNQWMTIKYHQKTDYIMLIKVLSLLAIFFMFFLYHHLQLKKYSKRLKYLSVTDALTEINNRIALDQQLDHRIYLAERYQQPFSIILLDIDLFKKINDGFGHLIGDYAIQTVSQLLKDNVRSVDILGRWGGEEFLIICPDQSVDGASLLAEKLRTIFDNYYFQHFSSLSCSFGVSAYIENDSSNQLITRADGALYRAKGQGRNKVCQG